MLVISPVKFYKVLIICCDMFESVITNEKHFKTRYEAEVFADASKNDNNIILVIEM